MNRREFQNAFPQTPAHFAERMESVLAEIEGMKAKKKRRVSRTVLIAAALILLLAGSAVAIGSAMGVFDFMKRVTDPIVPLQGAEELLESSLGYAEHNFGSVEIAEGIYSGRSCKVTVKVNNAEGYTHFYPEISFLNAQTPETGALDMVEGENGEIQYMMESMLAEDLPENLECKLSVPVFKNGEPQKDVQLFFTLCHAQEETAKLLPQNEGERWKIVSGSITRNAFSMVFDIEYLYAPAPDEDMGVDIKAFDASDDRYAEGDTSFDSRTLDDGTLIYRQISEIQSMKEMPDRIAFKPKVIGEDKWLDEIVCVIE